MASNQQSDTEDGVYFTTKENIDKAMKGSVFDLGKLDPEPEKEISDPSQPDVSILSNAEYYEYDGIGGEYLLPPQIRTTTPSQPDATPKIPTKRDVKSIYDEDGYALPDVDGCVTESKGVLKQDKGTESKFKGNTMKITGFIILLLVVGGVGGIAVAIFTGIIFFLCCPQYLYLMILSIH